MFNRLIGALIFSALLCPTAHAQMRGAASLVVTLRDASGKPVPGATMILREIATQRQYRSVSDTSGDCTFPAIPAGSYELSVRWRGLAAANSRSIQITSGERLRLAGSISNGAELELRWPKITQELTGKETGASGAARSQPSAALSTGGENLTGKEVSKLPLNGRDFGQLLLLTAGTMTDTNGAANFTQQYAVNGQRGVTAIFAMDGIDVTDPELGGATFDNFNVDAIQDIKSDSGVMPAEIGEGAAAFTNVITKSGTSQLHGDVFEFLRNSDLDARNFFDRSTPVNPGRLPHFERNEFGFTNGGPVVLPGLYDGRGRTYYFGEYQGFRQILGATEVLSVPTASERAGMDTTAFPGDTLTVPVSPAIAPVLARYPLPNDPEGPYGARTFATSSAVTTTSDQFSFRIDHRISDKAKLFSRFTFDNITGPTTNPSQLAIDPSFAIRFFDNERNFGLSYTRIFSPNLTADSSFGFIRATPLFPSINRTQPALDFGDGLYEPFNSAAGTITGSYGNLFQLRQTWTYVHGKHTFGWGAEGRFNRDTTVFGTTPNGQYTFGGGTAYSPVEITSASGKHGVQPGGALPDALSGLLTATPYSYTASIAYPLFPQGDKIGESAIHRDEYNFYFQDSWKARPGFTLNYGLRYEVGTPIREAHHLTSGPVFIGPDGKPAPTWERGVTEEVVFNPQPPDRYGIDWGGWAPRLGLEWRAAKQTIFSAGAAITTILPNLYQDNYLTGGFPIVIVPFLTASPGAPVPFVNGQPPIKLPTLYTSQGAPVFTSGSSMSAPPNTTMDIGRYEQGVAALTGGGAIEPISISGISTDFKNGYIATYTARLERDFRGGSVSASYVATAGVKLASIVFPNSYLGASPEFAPFTDFNAAGQAVGGYGPENLMSTRSHSSYNALQFSATKTSPRWGLGLQLSYTYSKALDDTSSAMAGSGVATQGTILQAPPQNPWNPGAEKGPSTFDLTHVLSFSAIQNLGLDRVSFLRNHLGTKLTSGWEFLNISTITSGPPFSVFSGLQQTGAGSNGADRPDQIGAPVLSTSRPVREDYFGLGAQDFTLFQVPIDVPGGSGPNQGRFGTLGRNTFRGPGFQDYDVALIKDTAFGNRHGTEAVTLEFRSEFFNVFNLANFGLPANIVRGSGFGFINHTAGPSRQLQFSVKLIY
ncbi:MAG: TonB-dependent receptor domain-containing protein [Terriglobia bacterium]